MASPGEVAPYPSINGFKGLNNRVDPIRLGLEYQLEAMNAVCDDAGYLCRRPGLAALAARYQDTHATANGRLLAIDAADNLVEINAAGESRALHAGVTGAPFQWAELGYAYFLMSAHAQWAVYPDRVIPWGSLCQSASGDPSGVIGDPASYPPPVGESLGVRGSQLVVGVHEADRDRSVLYFSRPDYPHEFRLDRDWIVISGQVTMLASLAQGLVIGTDRAIYVDLPDQPLVKVADYGVSQGGWARTDQNTCVFWTQRGLCRALPFENLTDARLAPILRETVTAGLFPWGGSTYVVVHQAGAVLPNRLTAPFSPLVITAEHPP